MEIVKPARPLNFSEALTAFGNRVFQFQGRSRRSEYWWTMLVFMCLGSTPGRNKYGESPKYIHEVQGEPAAQGVKAEAGEAFRPGQGE